MPTPTRGETRSHYMSRCVPYVLKENGTRSTDHAAAKCSGMWRQHRRMTTNAKPTTRVDPTRTGMLRRRWMMQMDKRFNALKRAIVKLVAEEDAFGLKKTKPFIVLHERWKFSTTGEQMEAFRQWLQMQVNEKVLESVDPSRPSDIWLQQYIEESYRKGQGRAFDDAMNRYSQYYQDRMDFYAGTREEFLRSSFGRPASIERVKQLAVRSYTDLKGVTDAMATSMHRTLMDGLIQGKSPRDVARELSKGVDGIGKVRARTIARTETIRAHAEGQLDALENLGVEEVGVMVEWSTALDDLVCPLCADMEGVVLKINEAHSLIPRHPNCRCAWIPANVGETTKDQVRGKTRIESAIERSVRSEKPKADSAEEARKLSRWAGADKKIGAVRPKPKVAPADKKPEAQTGAKAPKQLAKAQKVAPKQITLEDRIKGLDNIEQMRSQFVDEARKAVQEANELDRLRGSITDQINGEFKRFVEIGEKANAAGTADEAIRLNNELQAISDKINDLGKQLEAIWRRFDAEHGVRAAFENRFVLPPQERIGIQSKRSVKSVKFRSMADGGDQAIIKDTLTGRSLSKEMKRDIADRAKEAEQFVSKITKTQKGSKLQPGIGKRVPMQVHVMPEGERAFCMEFTNPSMQKIMKPQRGIYVTGQTGTRTYVHEMGHYVEARIPGASAKVEEFRKMRIARAGTPDVKLADRFPGYGYGQNEIGNDDDFRKAFSEHRAYYVGKDYNGNYTEILSMGLEELYTNPVELAEKDPEFFNFMVGLLRGEI